MTVARGISKAFAVLAEVAEINGAKDVKSLPGCWEYSEDGWRLALNGHPDPVEANGCSVLPYHFAIWRGGTVLGDAEDAIIERFQQGAAP